MVPVIVIGPVYCGDVADGTLVAAAVAEFVTRTYRMTAVGDGVLSVSEKFVR
jgi:hypothetical protein